MSGVENGELQCVDHTADGVDNTTGQKPAEGCRRKSRDDLFHGEDAHPAHGDVDHGRKPFGTGHPEGFDQDSHRSDGPYQSQQGS